MKLHHKSCKTAKKREKAYKLRDGSDLYLEVMPSGSKYWRLKYRINGKEKRLAIGVLPPSEAMNLDSKADDGIAHSGNILTRNERGVDKADSDACVDGNNSDSTDNYILSSEEEKCLMVYRID